MVWLNSARNPDSVTQVHSTGATITNHSLCGIPKRWTADQFDHRLQFAALFYMIKLIWLLLICYVNIHDWTGDYGMEIDMFTIVIDIASKWARKERMF